jgi:hypothetical protein
MPVAALPYLILSLIYKMASPFQSASYASFPIVHESPDVGNGDVIVFREQK